MINTSVLHSPEDPRDYTAESIFTTDIDLPEVFDPRKDLLPIRNQGSQGSCLAQAITSIKEIQERKNINFEDYFSPQFIYNNRENQSIDGMYPRDSMKILYHKGVPVEEDYPYGIVEKPEDIKKDITDKANNYRIRGYAFISTVNTLKAAIYKSGGAIVSFPVYSSIPNFWKAKNPEEKSNGAHAVSIIGWNKDGFILRNSYGSKYGDEGYIIYPYSDWGSHWEIWTFIDDESSKPDPKYSKWYWKLWRGVKNIHINLREIYVLEAGIVTFIITSFRDKTAMIVPIGILGYIIFKTIKNKLYLKKDK